MKNAPYATPLGAVARQDLWPASSQDRRLVRTGLRLDIDDPVELNIQTKLSNSRPQIIPVSHLGRQSSKCHVLGMSYQKTMKLIMQTSQGGCDRAKSQASSGEQWLGQEWNKRGSPAN